jgi:hypothetical protein
MKKIIYSFSMLTALALGLSSCKKAYLDTIPSDQVAASLSFSTTANAQFAVNGIYRNMYQSYANQDEGGESSIMIDNDMMGEDVVNPTTGSGWFIAAYRYITHRTVNATQLLYVYKYYYTIIENANAVIAGVDGAVGPDVDKKSIRGEALALRGYAHYQLVQLFGKRYDATAVPNTQLGIPIKLTPGTDPIARSTVEDVYTQINADLDAAITNLTGASPRATKSHINLNVVQGMKARVALTMQNYTVAITYAQLARTGFTLMTNSDYVSGFNNLANNEWIWGVNEIADQSTFFNSFCAYMSVNFNSTHVRTDPKCINNLLYNQISATDIRKQLWDPTAANPAFTPPPNGSRFPYMNRKFKATDSGYSYADLVFMRAGEMYLIEAEANARLGNSGPAQNALYTLAVNRDPAYVKSINTGQPLIDEILIQRRVELWGEGFRFLDLKRLNLPLNRNGANHVASVAVTFTLPAGDPIWQYLFPQAELNTNTLLVQNP